MRWSVTKLSIKWLNTSPRAAHGSPAASANKPTPIHQSCSPKWFGCLNKHCGHYLGWFAVDITANLS